MAYSQASGGSTNAAFKVRVYFDFLKVITNSGEQDKEKPMAVRTANIVAARGKIARDASEIEFTNIASSRRRRYKNSKQIAHKARLCVSNM
jgi:hypothetical protein